MLVKGKADRPAKLIALGMILLLAAGVLCPSYAAINSCEEQIAAYEREITYREYIARYAWAAEPEMEILISADSFSASSANVEIFEAFPGVKGSVIKTDETGYVEWEIEVEKPGFYNIQLTYYPIVGRGSDIEREVRINGNRPFKGAGYLSFPRVWADRMQIRIDSLGNEIRPPQVETPIWQTADLRDSRGYEPDPYKFHFQSGKNTIRLVSLSEPMMMKSIRLHQAKAIPTYAQVKRQYDQKGYQPTEGILIRLQERDVARKSSPTLFPVFDQGDPTVEPYDPVLIRLNAIGGYRWKNPGDWLSWDFVVPEDGLYKIAVKAKQDQQHGFYSNRKVLIDGAVPFQEVKAVSFPYSTYHRMYPLGVDESGNPVLFYLDKGQHELQLEVVLGGVADLLREAEDILYDLNTVYRRIIMITSPTPDPLRSYQLEKRIPGIIKQLGSLSEAVEGLAEKLEMMTGERGSHAATLTRISTLLERMSERPYTIPRLLGEYRDNVAALGAWIIQTQNQPLMIDYVIIASPNEPLPEAIPTTKDILRHERMAFLASFTHDYSKIGDMGSTSTQAQSIKVWIGSGRDQAQILKQMIEDTLTPQTGIQVDLELVESLSDPAGGGSATGAGGGGATSVMGNLLIPSTLAGTAPDVALGAANMDLAFRGAVVDLTQFPDFEEIAKRFKKSAFLPFRFRDKVFALPEVQGFPMLFYRKDILAELRIDIPQTWDDVYELIPELTKENLQFGIPAGMATYLMFLYQKGVALFKPDVVATNLDSEIAIQTFIELTDLFTLYNQPLVYNAENRFRLGEMPLVIANYDLFNTLSIFAPELRGEWGFTMVPGTRMPDGTINRTVAVTATQAAPGAVAVPPGTSGAIIMEQSENKQAAWEFLKWWTSEATQLRFGREMESLLGAAARYATANVQAFERLPWRAEERQVLLQQWDWVEGIPPVLGAYYVNRQFDWLFRSVVIQHERAREAVHDYNRPANEEIARKRKEFGLETSLDDLPDMWVDVYWSQYTHVNRLD